MARVCWDRSVPFLYVRSYGLLGHVRLVSSLSLECCVEAEVSGGPIAGLLDPPWSFRPRLRGFSPVRVSVGDARGCIFVSISIGPRYASARVPTRWAQLR